ncbi:MAG: hypothetical protein ABIF01_01965 [Candidatus Micrarchaeota archaeon]
MWAKRGQAAVELLIILAIAMTLLGAVIVTGSRQLNHGQTMLRLTQARSAVNDLAHAADVVYKEGEGAVRKVRVTIPDGVSPDRVFIDGKFVNVGVYVEGGESDVNAMSVAKLSGSLPSSPGTYWIYVGAREGCVVVGPEIDKLDC